MCILWVELETFVPAPFFPANSFKLILSYAARSHKSTSINHSGKFHLISMLMQNQSFYEHKTFAHWKNIEVCIIGLAPF